MPSSLPRFEVSLKAFILDGDCALFVRETETGYWELPGGRIDVGEEREAHAIVLARELGEELGPSLQVEFGSGAVTWTRAHPGEERYVFLVARIGRLVAGQPTLSPEHDALRWVSASACAALQFPPLSGYEAAIAELWRLAGCSRA
jgi:8-oxo-dGTP pyrophosphatase MutT (NUDIX family)